MNVRRCLGLATIVSLALALPACGPGSVTDADADLVELVVPDGALSPVFDPATVAYTVGVGHLFSVARLRPSTSNRNATVTVNGQPTASGYDSAPIPLAVGVTPVTIQVTATDGVTQKSYVVAFTRASSAAQEAYVKASNTEAGDDFGGSIALSGDTLVVGAQFEDSAAAGIDGNQADNTASGAGAVYVFVRSGATWTQQAYLKASNPDAGDNFGSRIGMWGDRIVVGAPFEDSAATGVGGNQADNTVTGAGAAYVFVRNGTTWTQEAYLKASNTGAADHFGSRVSISTNSVVVSAPLEDSAATGVNGNQADDSAADSGAAYTFSRVGTTWSSGDYLKASNTGAGDNFGDSIAISETFNEGKQIVVGATSEDSASTGVNGNQADDTATNSGAAYVFHMLDTHWSQSAYLKASNTGAGDLFGFSVVIAGGTIAVCAPREDSAATGIGGNQADESVVDSGAVYVFSTGDGGGSWSQQTYIKSSNTSAGDGFGTRAAISTDMLLVGAEGDDSNATGVDGDQTDNSVPGAGSAYVFGRNGTSWIQLAYLKASNPGAQDTFGSRVALSGDTVVLGAHGEDSNAVGVGGNQADNSATDAGAGYVFR